MGDQFEELVLRDAVVLSAHEMAAQLLGAIERDEGGDGDQAAVPLGEAWAFPDIAEQHLLGEIDQLGRERSEPVTGGGQWLGHGGPISCCQDAASVASMPPMRTMSPRRICIAALLFSMAPAEVCAQADADPALAAIARHPTIEARLKASKTRLAWVPLPVENDRTCYALQENHPTHMVTIGQYCLDRRTSTILEYDVAADRYIELK
jgi:hypothetical protein